MANSLLRILRKHALRGLDSGALSDGFLLAAEQLTKTGSGVIIESLLHCRQFLRYVWRAARKVLASRSALLPVGTDAHTCALTGPIQALLMRQELQ